MHRLSPIEYEILDLLRAGRELYGLEMVEASKRLKRGTIYVTLSRMTEKGYVESKKEDWAGRSGRPRRLYRIAGAGARALYAHDASEAASRSFVLPEGVTQ